METEIVLSPRALSKLVNNYTIHLQSSYVLVINITSVFFISCLLFYVYFWHAWDGQCGVVKFLNEEFS